MRVFISIILLLAIIGCHDDLMDPHGSLDQIELITDKYEYSPPDSIYLYLRNNSDFKIVLGYRCDYGNLEMYYQRYENDHWSEDRWFIYMYLLCPTVLKTVEGQSTMIHAISVQEFDSTGTYRLFVPFYVPEKDTSIVVTSNSFEII
jgi:hypothetical protein